MKHRGGDKSIYCLFMQEHINLLIKSQGPYIFRNNKVNEPKSSRQ